MKRPIILLLLVLGLVAVGSSQRVAGVLAAGDGETAGCGLGPNDAFTSAEVINKIPFFGCAETQNAGTSQNDPTPLSNCGAASTNGYGHSVWYKFTPGFDQFVDIDTFGSDFDTVLAAFVGTKGNLTQIACNDDAQAHQSAIKVNLNGGTTYYFLVASFSDGPGGNLEFHVLPRDDFFFDDLALKCYQAKIAKRSARFQQQSLFTFDANLRIRSDVNVTGLSLYCNQASQDIATSPPPGASGDLHAEDLKVTCYTARDREAIGPPVAGRAVFAQNKFGDQKLTLSRLESVCVIALKAGGQLPNFTPYNGEVLRCYAARPVKGSARFDTRSTFLVDQFSEGGKNAKVLRPVSYCTLSSKGDDFNCLPGDCCQKCNPGASGGLEPVAPPPPLTNAVVCYSLRQASFHPFDVPVIDQFLDQQFVDPLVTIKKADRYCVSSEKKPPFAPNDDISNATTIDVEQQPGTCTASVEFCPVDLHVVTMNATRARNDPPMVHCASVTDHVDYGHSVWYTYTPNYPEDASVDVDTEDSSYDTVLAVYTGSKGHLTQIACNDDDPDHGKTSKVELDLQVGQKYYFMVGSKNRTPGGKLKLSFDACPGDCDD